MSVAISTDPLVREAVDALSAFGPPDRATAALLLAMWARRDALTDGQVRAVLRAFPRRAVR